MSRVGIYICDNINNKNVFLDGLNPQVDQLDFNPINLQGKYKYVGFVWENSPELSKIPWGKSFNQFKWFSDELVEFINVNPGITIHLITCNLFSNTFINEVNLLNKSYPNVKIGYSLGEMGSEPGTWILHNLNVDIKSLYFTDKIDKWEHILWYYPFISSFNFNPNKLYVPGTLVSVPNSSYSANYDISNVSIAISNIAGDSLSVLKGTNTVSVYDILSIQTACYDLFPNVTKIYTNYNSWAALKSDGCVSVWGVASSGGLIPATKISQLICVKNITATVYAYAALKTNGSVVTWGEDMFGGNSSIANYIECINSIVINYVPVAKYLCSGVIKIFSNLYSFAALKSDGSVITWGYSLAGGNSSVIYYSIGTNCKEVIKDEISVKSKLTSGVINIFSTKNAFAALKSNGSVVTWGSYKHGGNSSAIKSDLSSGVIYIASTGSAFAALKSDGSVVTWGSTASGGISTDVSQNLLSGVITIASTLKSFAALKTNGSVVTWGSSSYGGNSSNISFQLASNVVGLYSNGYAFAALKSNGSVITWGDPTKGGDSSNITNLISNGVVEIYSSNKSFAALKSDNSVVTWGDFWLGGNLLVGPEKKITSVIGGNNFLFISTNQQIPFRSRLISTSIGQAQIYQNDLSHNICGFEYKLINWTNKWCKLDLSNYKITSLGQNKTYYISLRSFNNTGLSESNDFPVQSDSSGNIKINIIFSGTSTQVGTKFWIDNSLNKNIDISCSYTHCSNCGTYFQNLTCPNCENYSYCSTNSTTGTCNIQYNPCSTICAPICFVAGTPINTDQGKIAIEKINPLVHTIRSFPIQAITQTISPMEWIVCIEPNALGNSIPSTKTLISSNHKVFCPRLKLMVGAKELIDLHPKHVYPIKYSGEILYNVLLETHEKMIVNNMIVETLDPTNIVAQIYSKKFSPKKREYLIEKFNYFIKTKSKKEFNELAKYLI